LCGIYSGLITDFSQITDVSPLPAPGQFQLVYRSDASGLTFGVPLISVPKVPVLCS
jgi:ABC-type phosphate transport system substrate-binding protein